MCVVLCHGYPPLNGRPSSQSSVSILVNVTDSFDSYLAKVPRCPEIYELGIHAMRPYNMCISTLIQVYDKGRRNPSRITISPPILPPFHPEVGCVSPGVAHWKQEYALFPGTRPPIFKINIFPKMNCIISGIGRLPRE